MISTGRYEFYSMFLEDNNFNSNKKKILVCFIFLKSIKIRFLVLIIWYVLKNPVYLSLLPSPPKMYALDLESSQSPEDTWNFFCLLAPECLPTCLHSLSNQAQSFETVYWFFSFPYLRPGIAQNLNHSALS